LPVSLRWKEGGAVEGTPRQRRPLLRADLSHALSCAGGDPAARHDAAHETAARVLAAGRTGAVDLGTLLHLADSVGLDELGALWRAAAPGSLPATLWTLYLLRAWCHRRGEEVARLYRCGRVHAEVAAAVAGLPEGPSGADAAAFADALLTAVFGGDLGTSLQRAAAFCRVVAAGRGDLIDVGGAPPEIGFGGLDAAASLDRAAAAWRAGSLH
jgi:hypothetical protein